jgi:hypothetical protein
MYRVSTSFQAVALILNGDGKLVTFEEVDPSASMAKIFFSHLG